MSKRKWIFITAAIILILLVVVLVGARSRGKASSTAGTLDSDDAPYSVRGTYTVGVQNLTTGGETPLGLTLWYPALSDDNQGKGITYVYKVKMGQPFGTIRMASFEGQALQDAPYDLSMSPYPLVILSPGFSVGSTAYAWLAEHLASYGFVVLSPEHDEHLDTENELWQRAITRPQDILQVFDYVDREVGSNPDFAALVDPQLVAMAGHSYGGYTALAAGGAQVDTDSFKAFCETVQASGEPGAWLCDMLSPHIADMADLAGLDDVPAGLWPATADPRVDAVVSMAGDAFFFGQPGLSVIDIPVMAIGGTADEDSPYKWNTHPTYEYLSSSKKVEITLNEAEHMIFTACCESTPFYMKLLSGEFCSDTVWDRSTAHALVKHFTTAFLLAELEQDPQAAAALAPEPVDFPDVSYQAQGY